MRKLSFYLVKLKLVIDLYNKSRWVSLTKISEESTTGYATASTVTSKNLSFKMSSSLLEIRKFTRRMRQLRDHGFTSKAEVANDW